MDANEFVKISYGDDCCYLCNKIIKKGEKFFQHENNEYGSGNHINTTYFKVCKRCINKINNNL